MPITLFATNDERLASDALCTLVRNELACGSVVVLVPTFAEVLHVQTVFAHAGLALGVQVSTPQAWVRDLWDLWGDGQQVVDDAQRLLLMTDVLRAANEEAGRPEETLTGTVQLLCGLAKRGLPWMDKALASEDVLTAAEYRIASLVGRYEQVLAQRGLIEYASCVCALPGQLGAAGVSCAPLVLAGFNELAHAERELVLGLAARTSVTLVERAGNPFATQCARESAALLEREAKQRKVVVEQVRANEPVHRVERASELKDLLQQLYVAGGTPVSQTGAVRLLEPAGPLAEAELMARAVAELANDGACDVVVVVPNTNEAWRTMAPKLVARGMSVQAQLSIPVLETEAGRAFMGYARTVAQLVDLARTWPEPLEGTDGPYVRIGSMDWWPPRELTDFLLCDIAHVRQEKAYALDVVWRSDRLLSPQDVLNHLLSGKMTSDAVERATRELLRGRLGSAASKLLAHYVQKGAADPVKGSKESVSLAHETNVAVLAAIVGVAGTLKELGVTADQTVSTHVSLRDLVAQAELALGSMRVTLRPQVEVASSACSVLLSTRSAAATLSPASVDAVCIAGLTSQEYGVPSTDDELTGMLEDLRLEAPRNALASQRSEFWHLCALPRTTLLLERAMFSSDANETYPAVMLTEVSSCYLEQLPRLTLPEDAARENLSVRGAAPAQAEAEKAAPAGHIHSSLRRLVTVPQEGKEELAGSLPVLSASQLESYLECPLKWFSLRRLRLGNNDAGFGPLEMGTFAHRVLELTYGQLFEEGQARLDPNDAQSMAHAHNVLNEIFTLHVEHQRMKSGKKPVYQALIPHTAQEESALDQLRRDLLSSLDYEAERLWGYEPRAFEWEFGRGARTAEQEGLPSLEVASYAGVQVTGTVDRIDLNGQGQAVIIDYKHKGPTGFFAEYAALSKAQESDDEFVLPRRIQALMYAQVVRRAFPELKVVGALYLSTRGNHELSGAVDEAQADAIFGGKLGSRRAKQVVVEPGANFGQEEQTGFTAFLDATEAAIARKIERLREGHIEAEPLDAAACSFCPVTNCERKITK